MTDCSFSPPRGGPYSSHQEAPASWVSPPYREQRAAYAHTPAPNAHTSSSNAHTLFSNAHTLVKFAHTFSPNAHTLVKFAHTYKNDIKNEGKNAVKNA